MQRVLTGQPLRAVRSTIRGAATPLLLLAALAWAAPGCTPPAERSRPVVDPAAADGGVQTGGTVQDPQDTSRSPELEPLRPLLGKSLEEAEQWLAQNPTSIRGVRVTKVRPVVRDGEALIVTKDYREDRLNVAIRDGSIVELRGTG